MNDQIRLGMLPQNYPNQLIPTEACQTSTHENHGTWHQPVPQNKIKNATPERHYTEKPHPNATPPECRTENATTRGRYTRTPHKTPQHQIATTPIRHRKHHTSNYIGHTATTPANTPPLHRNATPKRNYTRTPHRNAISTEHHTKRHTERHMERHMEHHKERHTEHHTERHTSIYIGHTTTTPATPTQQSHYTHQPAATPAITTATTPTTAPPLRPPLQLPPHRPPQCHYTVIHSTTTRSTTAPLHRPSQAI